MEFPELFTRVLAIVTLVCNVFAVAYFSSYIIARPLFVRTNDFFRKYVLVLGFLFASGATIGSLIYSEVVGFPACILCWTQRIFMYPLMFLFGLALFRKEKYILPYTFLLTCLGGAVALYHWVKDMLAIYGGITIPCPAVSSLPSCDKIYVLEYGYITIPMIALSMFVLIGIVLGVSMRQSRHE